MIETLSVGATMLLPPLRERMELLHSLLPQGPDRWESLSKGQVPDATYCVDGAARCFKQPVKNSPPPVSICVPGCSYSFIDLFSVFDSSSKYLYRKDVV